MGKGVLPICHLTLRAKIAKPNDYPRCPQTLGEHLKRRRMDLGLIQREVAQTIGVNTASVWNWENGYVEPGLRFIPAILMFLGGDPCPIKGSIGDQLVWFRQGRGWSQKHLAKELKVDPSTLSRWELGKRIPSGVYGIRIRSLTHVEIP
jgi:transcriptional regulator with XRE-family HTH domain